MTEEIIEGVNPTRMELLEIRKKLELAQKGHDLLEQKRDALVERFFSVIDKRDQLRKGLDEEFKNAFLSLIQAQMILGEEKVKEISHLTREIPEISIEQDNIMGVAIPKCKHETNKINIKPEYGFLETTGKIDDAYKQFRVLIKKLIELADIEGSIQSISIEIEKTKRRVNVLENNLIPRLIATKKYIEMQLEEREREDFFRRKRIKALLELKEEL